MAEKDTSKNPLESLVELVNEEIQKSINNVAVEQARSQDPNHRHYLTGIQRGYQSAQNELYKAYRKIKRDLENNNI